MKAFRVLGRSISEGLHSVFRNFSLSMASIICTTITLILVAIAIVISANVDNFTQEIERDLTIVVFVDNKATEEDINTVKTELNKISNIDQDEMVYKSKEEVKEEMRSQSEVFNTVMSQWDDSSNPLKNTFQIKVKNIEKINDKPVFHAGPIIRREYTFQNESIEDRKKYFKQFLCLLWDYQ